MTVCARIKGYTRAHEWIADLSSLLGVALLFGSIWLAIEYQALVFQQIATNPLVSGPLLLLLLLVDVFLVFFLLNIGSARFAESDDDRCFHTFRGRRHGGGSLGSAVHNWIDHLEHVNKKHR